LVHENSLVLPSLHFPKLLLLLGFESRAGRSQLELLIFIVVVAIAVNLPGQLVINSNRQKYWQSQMVIMIHVASSNFYKFLQ
jgi:hypothetical protein